jgi:hypothetical protein
MAVDDFPAKLALVLKVLSLGRGRLASELRVDKSVVARWLSGVHAPTGNNLSNLNAVLAARRPGFTVLDWELDAESFARKLRPAEPETGPGPKLAANGPADWIPAEVVREALLTTAARGEAYEGFWRSTRPAIDAPDTFIHDRILIRKADHGLLEFRLAVIDMQFVGVAFPTQTQIFSLCADPNTGIFIFSIFNAVLRHRADVMDGLSMTVQRLGGGSPVATPVLLERTGVLGNDPAADDARHAAESQLNPFAPPNSVPDQIVAHLRRDIGREALAATGPMLLTMPFATSMSRGPDLNPHPRF